MEDLHLEIKAIPAQATWNIRYTVMWPNKSIDYVKLPADEEGLHLGLFVQGKLTSIVSAFIVDYKAQFRKFATLEEGQGKGYGSRLLSYLFNELKSKDVTVIWCNARVDKATYYEQFGLRRTNQCFARGEIEYVIMEMRLDRASPQS